MLCAIGFEHCHFWAKKDTPSLTKNLLIFRHRIKKGKHTMLTSIKRATIYTCDFFSWCQHLLRCKQQKSTAIFFLQKRHSIFNLKLSCLPVQHQRTQAHDVNEHKKCYNLHMWFFSGCQCCQHCPILNIGTFLGVKTHASCERHDSSAMHHGIDKMVTTFRKRTKRSFNAFLGL